VSPLDIVALVGMVLGYGAAAALFVAAHGWRRGLVRFADILCWSLVVCAGPRLIARVAGDLASWCALPVFLAASWFGRTSLGILNFLVLQWFGVRLARTIEIEVDPAAVGRVGRVHRVVGWSLLRWVWPLTGWWSDYRWIARRR